MHRFIINDGELTVIGQIVGRYGQGYDKVFIVESEGRTYHIKQTWMLVA